MTSHRAAVSSLRHHLRQLLLNVRAGTRLAAFMPVRRLDFRIGIGEALALFVLSAVLDFASDWIRYGPNAYFSLMGAGSELFSGGLLVFTAAVLGLAFRQPALVLALPVVVLSALPLVQIVHSLHDAAVRWWPVPMRALGDIEWLFLAWLVVVLVRATAVALLPGGRRRWVRTLAGALALAAPLWLAPALAPNEPWWRQPALHGGVDPRYPSPAAEPVLAIQAKLLDQALSDLDDERPNVTDLYFVAFGGVASEDVFRNDVESARKVMDERWDTADRSIVLLNNSRTLLETPIASLTNLRETLTEIAGAMNPEEDVLMLYLASHGRPEELEVSLPPLELTPVTPTGLRALLDESGIKWRIIVVSSCYSGSFIPALQDDNTLVITAARADRTSFGCGYRSERTYFGEAFFDHGMARADSITAAFDKARARIAQREQAEHFSPPSEPQIYVGAAMTEKLKELERGNASRAAGRLVCAACVESKPGAARTQDRVGHS